VPILLLLAGVVILAGVVSVAMGHGGEMAEFAMDYLPPDVMTAADVARLRPPSAFWGYNVQVTDEALSQAAQAITEREVEIAVLRQQLADLRSASGSHPAITAAALLARSQARADAPAGNAARLGPPGLNAPGLGPPPHPAEDPPAPDPGSGTGPADTGPAGTGPAGTGPAGTGPAGTGLADPGPRSGGTAASRDE
jgi:hypothetical protein